MKNLLTIVFLAVLTIGCSSDSSQSSGNPQVNANQDSKEMSASSLTPTDTIDQSQVIVAVISEQEIYVRKQRVARAQIAAEVNALLWNLPVEKRIVYLKAMPNVNYGLIVSIIDEVKAIGYDQIGLLAHKDPRKPSTTSNSVRTSELNKRKGEKPASEQANKATEDLLVVTVETATEAQIVTQVGGARVPLSGLANKVRGLLKDRSDKSVRIIAPATIDYGSIVQVIDELKAGGADSIGLGVKSP